MTRKLRSTWGAVSGWLGLTTIALGLGCQGPSINVLDLGGGPQIDLTGAAQESYFRIGHFLVGLGSFDICVKGADETDFRGPLLHLQTQRVGGVPYAGVSAYLTVAPTAYTVRAVGGSATDCSNPLGGLRDLPLTPLSVGRHYTISASGLLSQLPTVKFNLIEDDLSTQGGQARLRFINAASEVSSADLGFGSGTQYAAQLTGATYGSIGFASGQAYLTTGPLVADTIAARSSGSSTDLVVVPKKITIAAGTVATVVLEGSSIMSMFTPLALVVCNDSAPAVSGLSSCTELP